MKDFILYPEALELKQLGFDEPCFGVYATKDGYVRKSAYDENGDAPTYSQAFRWFREKHGLHHTIMPEFYKDGINFNWQILWYLPKDKWTEHVISKGTMCGEYPSQEEAELACLIKLIEIVKNK